MEEEEEKKSESVSRQNLVEFSVKNEIESLRDVKVKLKSLMDSINRALSLAP